MVSRSIRRQLPGLLVAAVLVAQGCGKPETFTPPPTEVAVIEVSAGRLEEIHEFAGNVEASRSVQVRAQVGGVIQSRPFNEGQAVKVGDVLFRLDRTAYDAEFRSAQARLTEAEARAANARQTLARYESLLKDNAVSRQDYDNAASLAQQAAAAAEDARGTADRARKNLDDTVVRAELAGRVGKALLEVGARVRGPEDVLTTIDVLDPIYVTFRPSAQQQLAWRRNPEANRLLRPGSPLRFEAILPDGSPAPSVGRLDFIDPVVDPATGTQQLRAEFVNRDRLLVPGQFVRIRMLGLARDSAIVIPQRAVLLQMGRQTVYLVAGDSVVARDVVASSWTGDRWLIDQGLAPGDKVIVDGIQKVGPGSRVKAVPAP
jgi:membrane fusion protein (multidrug efflux system)